ncbi:hypothetical protein LSAT2_030904 [Lamellibrachia satsuma]|nr:hypothetical protein LSAT2_030904 [Lamellibrachia satsuma]
MPISSEPMANFFRFAETSDWTGFYCLICLDLVTEDGSYQEGKQWEKGDKFCEGSAGVVFKATDSTTKHEFVVKKVKKQDGVHETRVMSTLQHVNIVQLYGYLQNVDNFYILMESVVGFPLNDIFEQQKSWCFEECILFVKQLLAAVAHCEENNVVHRDISGANVLILAKGCDAVSVTVTDDSVKLIDFDRWAKQSPSDRDVRYTMVLFCKTVQQIPPMDVSSHRNKKMDDLLHGQMSASVDCSLFVASGTDVG